MTPAGDPLPSEDEADRLFREVAPVRSAEPTTTGIDDGIAAVAAAARDTATRAVAVPTATAGRGVRRVRDLPWSTLGPPAVVVAGVAALALLLGHGEDRLDYVILPPVPAQSAPGTGTPPRPPPEVCVSAMPAFTDEYYPTVACDSAEARVRILGLVRFEGQSGYPGPTAAARAEELCRQEHGIASDGEVLVTVPSEHAWYVDRARYAVCARPVVR